MTAPGPSPTPDRRQAASPEFPHIRTFVAELAAGGLRHVCISPGARSTPLTVSFAREPRIKSWSHIDERSNAFFALGIAKATRTATAIVCTSGTAAANFFPAVIEAAHAGVPLIVLTGDRPPELRDCEAGQTIDQIKLYGDFPKWFAEVGTEDSGLPYFRTLARRALRTSAEVPPGVVHLNFPLREPLIADNRDEAELADATAPVVVPAPAPVIVAAPAPVIVTAPAPRPAGVDIDRLASLIRSTPRGILICGPADLTAETADAIDAVAERSGYPIIADPTSQLRRAEHADRVIDSYDALIANAPLAAELTPEVVLRFGGMPVCKPLRLWLERYRVPQIVVDPNGHWNDPSGTAAEVWRTDVEATCNALLDRLSDGGGPNDDWRLRWLEASHTARDTKDSLVRRADFLSGVGLFARLARELPEHSTLYVGNSLPIRQLEAIWPADAGAVRILCNRGANGIDGVVSSVLGAAATSSGPVVGVLGDLSFYHDLNGLMAAKRHAINATFIVPNNDGGGIFSMLPQSQLGALFDEYFTTPHGLDFRHAAAMYGCTYDRVDDWAGFDDALARALASSGTNLIEIPIDSRQDLEITRNVTSAQEAS